MNIFSKKRYLNHFYRKTSTLLAVLATLVSTSTAFSQSSSDLFRGTWQIETPDDGALILIVKRNGLASYFWGDNTDRTVYQGTWTSTDEVATLTWPDGNQHQIVRDALGYGISSLDANQNTRYTVQAQQVPKEILGQWAKPPSREKEVVSARDQAKGFFGVWQIGDATSGQYITVEADRSAASNWGDSNGLRGSWAKQGSELHIAWDSGEYSILRENERTFAYKQVKSGVVIEDDSTEFTTATRTVEDNLPSTWRANYTAERELSTGGIAFSSRQNARAFYRGSWLVRVNEKSFERIEIARFGGLTTSADRKLEGSWRMDGQDLFMRWDNGSRRILSPIGEGFVIYEYKPGRPLDGVPTRILAAAPEDTTKLAEHLKGRKDVADQMISLAEAAGIDPAQQQAGWGRTFARWAWPFGDDETAVSSDALLEESYEEANETDPWWWPFWSETTESSTSSVPEDREGALPITDETAAEVEAPTVTVTSTELEPTATSEETEIAPKANKKSPKKQWAWPF